MTYEIVSQDPAFRALVQQNALTRMFYGPLMPRLLWRMEFDSAEWGAQQGLTKIDSRRGLMKPSAQPVKDGEPTVDEPPYEQWIARLFPYGRAVDIHVPSSVNAAVPIFNEKLAALGEQAGLTLNIVSRNALYRAALCGQTYLTGAASTATSLSVRSLNGLTQARRPDLAAGSPVQFADVSSSNPLSAKLWNGTAEVTVSIIGYTATNGTDDVFLTGPGTVTLAASVSAPAGAYLRASDASNVIRPGAAKSSEGLSASSRFRFSHIRAANSHMSNNSVPTHPDRYYHCHLNSTSQDQLFEDPELQRLNTSLPEYIMYKDFAIGVLLGCVYYKNEEAPNAMKVDGGSTDTWSKDDPFPGSTVNTSGVGIERPVFTGAGGLIEYWQDPGLHVAEIGAAGRTQRFASSFTADNGINISLPQDRVVVIIRPPQDRFQERVSAAWKGVLGPIARTDASTNRGSLCRHKRQVVVEHGT